MAVLKPCAPKPEEVKKRGCCDPCDAEPAKPAAVLTPNAPEPVDETVWKLDGEVDPAYPILKPSAIFSTEVDCCKLPVELQPHCGGCKPKCKDCRVVDETVDALPDFAPQ